ncbi:MAG: hypothetical protein ABW321_24410 [Polyangiales bacterium]
MPNASSPQRALHLITVFVLSVAVRVHAAEPDRASAPNTPLPSAASDGQQLAPGAAEPIDTTRLDVERLPPEALPLSRDMFRLGWHLRAELGGQGFIFGVGRISLAGPVAHVALGYDFATWFLLALDFGLAMHGSDAPPPPAASVFQLYTALAQARFSAPIGTRAALWLSLDAGGAVASGDFLQVYGFRRAGELGLVYGGGLGFDWHLRNAHHALGLKAAGHLYPQLAAANGERSVALEATAYLKYVF